ncbi:RIP metalloprotease [Actinocrinis puniceicyclus]|uniref:RIP metalloprotease n=1 Tax=Actinocrinis puniceicyclus TaxID=977794 RepID=A0A8J7WIK1_9ACTN|nr:M50 family metallopeptidase [Actinocrinis puniceicyclus]MBS2962861.1 RIP metalloprotease [Actinocrinis puniceicyclus]
MNVLGALLFVLALLVSIVLHEAGHMVCARWSGGKVTEFFVGFGTRLWSFKRGETEYGIKAIPAGGYVKIVGMTDLDEIEPGDEDRALKNKPARMRLLTLSAGSLTHFLIALVLFFLSPMLFGVQKADTSARVGHVSACLTSDGSPDESCAAGSKPSPAARAGLSTGDLITAIAGRPIKNFDDLATALHQLPAGQPSALEYTDPQGRAHATTVVPVGVKSVTYPDGHTAAGSLVGLGQNSYTQHYSPISAAGYSGQQFGSMIVNTFKGLGSIPAAIPKLFTATVDHTQRSASSPVGVVGMAQISGTIIGQAGFAGFFALVAAVNVFIGVFNLLPILPLDGGHVAVLLYEEARKRLYRLLHRPAPGRVDLNKLMPVAYAFLLVFVGLTLLLLAADITNPIHLPS